MKKKGPGLLFTLASFVTDRYRDRPKLPSVEQFHRRCRVSSRVPSCLNKFAAWFPEHSRDPYPGTKHLRRYGDDSVRAILPGVTHRYVAINYPHRKSSQFANGALVDDVRRSRTTT